MRENAQARSIESFQALVDWIGRHPEHAGWVIFLVSMAESLAIVGVLIPGVVILLGNGSLIGTGGMDFSSSCSLYVAGAHLCVCLGDDV
mgnify:CR=1 FL=1